MRFTIDRTSSASSDAPPPHHDAIRNPAQRDLPIDASQYAWNPERRWVIDVTDLDALLKICEDGDERLIVTTGRNHPHIEIYDDYRE